jgi:FtsP/CotA-like multicopper oxidase with cupredoxin domain
LDSRFLSHVIVVRFTAVVALCAWSLIPRASSVSAAPQAAPGRAPCGGPIRSGEIVEPPQVDAASLPLNDLGRHELILRVARQGDQFCYRYTLDGVQESRAPVLRVRRGERFAIRLVNELGRPAPGATQSARTLATCKPSAMPAMPSQAYAGYMNHVIQARSMSMKDTDVNLHLHGFQGAPEEENVFLSTLSTPAHACEYDITIPRTQPPGTYFYHAHAHEMSDDEVSGGLSGMWIVEPDAPQLPRADDHAIVLKYRIPYIATDNFLSDLTPLYFKAGHDEAAAAPASPVEFDPFNPPAWPSSIPLHTGNVAIYNRCGNRSSVAMTVDRTDVPGVLTVPAGQTQLLRVLNATGDSPLYLRMRGGTGESEELRVVGRDGTPVGGDDAHPLSQYVAMREMTLPPAGRADVLLTLATGETVTVYGAHACQAPADEVEIPTNLLVVRSGDQAASPVAVASAPLKPAQSPAMQLLTYARSHPRQIRRRAFTYSEYVFPGPHGHGLDAEYFITETSNKNFHEHPYWPEFAKGARAPAPDIVVKRGSIEEWDLFNATVESHTLHIHQMNFVAVNETPLPATLDTVMVPFGTLLPNKKNPDYPLIRPSRTRVLLDFRNVPRGTFVFHCHMLFHEDRGMMGVIRVV